MKLVYRPQAVKQIKKFSRNDQKKVIKKLELLAEDPLSGKKLKGELEGLRSVRAWPFRIVYELQKKRIVVLSVTHRQSAYK